MNSKEFESWLQQQAEEGSYEANEKGWQQLQAAMQQEKHTSKKAAFLLPYKIAAALVLATGIASYIYFSNQDTTGVQPAATQTAQSRQQPGAPAIPVSDSSAAVISPAPAYPQQPAGPANIPVPQRPAAEKPAIADIPSSGDKSSQPETFTAQQQPVPTVVRNSISYLPVLLHTRVRPYRELAVSLQTGMQQLGGMQYQLGITRRVQLARRLFVDGTVTVASSAVSYSEQHQFSGVSVLPGNAASGLDNVSTTTTRVETVYKQPVYSLGIAPVLGFNISKKWSISGGSYLNRNINTTIALQDQADDISNTLISESNVPASYKAAPWDWGILAGTEYRVHRRLKIQAGYRIGMTDFLMVNRSVRNTGMNLGIKYTLGK